MIYSLREQDFLMEIDLQGVSNLRKVVAFLVQAVLQEVHHLLEVEDFLVVAEKEAEEELFKFKLSY